MSATRQPRNIALIGFMGTGKSSVGRMLARDLDFEFLDTDEWIEEHAGKTISRIFAEEGEPAFRDLEGQVVTELASRSRLVIATGGGLGANPAHLAALREHALVVCLWASPESIWQRVRTQSHRPLLRDPDPLQKIRVLLAQREPVYRQADVLLNTEMRSVREIVQHVLHAFRAVRARHSDENRPAQEGA
jgi:shikimate kinase